MTGKTIISRIQKHRAALEKFGVRRLAVFGSVARGQADKDSDVDILVEFDGAPTFDGFMDTKFFLEDLLGRRVDLVVSAALKPRIRDRIQRDLVYVT
jgi:predicted nucleotidyltransferase